jgi:uncharacterized protein YcfJ
MKKILIIPVLLATALAGCTGSNQAIGTGVGAVGGYGVARALGAGSGGAAVGAVAGALIGNSVGQSIDQNQRYYQAAPQPRRVYIEERYVISRPYCRYERIYDPYYHVYRTRRICR